MGIGGVQFAGLDQRGDHRPVLRPGVMARDERVLSIEGNWTDRAFDGVGVRLDPTVGQEQDQTFPVFGDVFQCLAER